MGANPASKTVRAGEKVTVRPRVSAVNGSSKEVAESEDDEKYRLWTILSTAGASLLTEEDEEQH